MRSPIQMLYVAVAVLTATMCGCSNSQRASDNGAVVVYTSVDEVFAEPICQQFEKEKSGRMRSEAGLTNELWAGAINFQANSIVGMLVRNVNKKILILTNKIEKSGICLPDFIFSIISRFRTTHLIAFQLPVQCRTFYPQKLGSTRFVPSSSFQRRQNMLLFELI